MKRVLFCAWLSVGAGCAVGSGGTDGGACAVQCHGCCAADGTCQSGSSVSACGAAGAACQACVGSQQCTANGCQDSSCPGCVDPHGVCQAGTTTTACGQSGLTCASCGGGQVCSGGQCTTTTVCPQGCPNGYRCQSGVCIGGSPTGLALNVVTPPQVTVSGTVTLNGGAPGACSSGSTEVLFANKGDDNWSTSFSIPCGQPYSFSGTLAAGTYDVVVKGLAPISQTGLPPWAVTTLTNVSINASGSYPLNVVTPPQVSVSGTVTLNGGSPGPCTAGSTEVLFTNKGDEHWSTSFTIPCGQAYAFNGTVAAGTYDIAVKGSAPITITGLPQWPVTALSNVSINAGGTYTLNVVTPPQLSVSGTVKLNGAAPGSCITGSTEVLFTNKVDENWNTSFTIPCGVPYTFYGLVAAGTYDIAVKGFAPISQTGLPQWPVLAVSNANINASGNYNLNVVTPPQVNISGLVTLNGGAPGACGAGSTEVLFTNKGDDNWSTSFSIPCGHPYSFSGTVAAGTYDISVKGLAPISQTGLPQWAVTAVTNVGINAQGSYTVNVVTPPQVSVSGNVTLNGGAPGACISGSTKVLFMNKGDDNWSTSFNIPCGAPYAFNGTVAAGTYDIAVKGLAPISQTGLPQWMVTTSTGVSINAGATYALNVVTPPQLGVSGTVTLNGAPPGTCLSGSTEVLFGNTVDDNWSTSFSIPCGQPYAFGGLVAAGTYDISVKGLASTSQTGLPQWSVLVYSRVQVQ